MSATSKNETRTRTRTRRAILDAAVEVFGAQPSAALADVARAAGVSRSTVQRYFPERTDLLRALSAYASERVDEATARVPAAESDPLVVLTRLMQEYFELGDLLMLTFSGSLPATEPEEEDEETNHVLAEAVERGHREGTVDAELSAEWIEQLMWSTLFAAWNHVTEQRVPKHEALTVCLRSFGKAVRA